MSDGESSSSSSGPRFRSGPLITGAALVGAGTFIIMAGLAVGGAHLVSAIRQWVSEMETPPSELAKNKWAQARTAVAAGASAWQNGSAAGTPANPESVS